MGRKGGGEGGREVCACVDNLIYSNTGHHVRAWAVFGLWQPIKQAAYMQAAYMQAYY